jgi:hypothetical protein
MFGAMLDSSLIRFLGTAARPSIDHYGNGEGGVEIDRVFDGRLSPSSLPSVELIDFRFLFTH